MNSGCSCLAAWRLIHWHLLLGGAVNPSVGDRCLPMKQEVVFFLEAAELAILQSVILDVFVYLCHAQMAVASAAAARARGLRLT
jgi:hypothetical protein